MSEFITYLLSRLHYGMWQVGDSTLFEHFGGLPCCLQSGRV